MNRLLVVTALVIGMGMLDHNLASAQTAYSRVVTNDHPALYWNFDEASGNAKEVEPVSLPGNSNDLVPQGNVTRVSHSSLADGLNLGNAASFEIGDYFMVQNLALPTNSLAAPWALEFWMQVQGDMSFQRNNYLMNFGGAGGNAPAVLYDYVGGAQPRYGLELFAGGQRTGAGPLIQDENWHQVMFVYYGNGTNGVSDRLDVYVDGTNAAQGIRGTFNSPISLTRFIVGTSAPQFAGSDGFEGNMDEVAVYSLSETNESAITAHVSTMASNHYSLAFTTNSYSTGVLADHPLLYYNFDEASGNALDLAPFTPPVVQNDLVPAGGATHVSHLSLNSALGLGNAANIPKGGYFSIGQIIYPSNSIPVPWMMEFWMQVTGSQDTQRNNYIANFGRNAPALLYDYVGGAQPRDGLELFYGGVGRSGAGPIINDSKWHHVIFAYYGNGTVGFENRLDVYVDGVDVATNVSATFADSSLGLSSLVVGTSGGQFAVADGFEGNLDEFALYDLSSSPTEDAMTARVADIAARHFAAAQVAQLSIAPVNGQLAISYNASFTNLTLQSTVGLSPATWSKVNITPVVNNGVATVNVPMSGRSQFFRLISQP